MPGEKGKHAQHPAEMRIVGVGELEDGTRYFDTVITADVVDRQGEVLDPFGFTVDEYRDILQAPIHDTHSNIPVGRFLPESLRYGKVKDPSTEQEVSGLLGRGIIHNAEAYGPQYEQYPIWDEVWNHIKSHHNAGKPVGVSIGGDPDPKIGKQVRCENGKCHIFVPKVYLYEVSVVRTPSGPANPLAMISNINASAKSGEQGNFEARSVSGIAKGLAFSVPFLNKAHAKRAAQHMTPAMQRHAEAMQRIQQKNAQRKRSRPIDSDLDKSMEKWMGRLAKADASWEENNVRRANAAGMSLDAWKKRQMMRHTDGGQMNLGDYGAKAKKAMELLKAIRFKPEGCKCKHALGDVLYCPLHQYQPDPKKRTLPLDPNSWRASQDPDTMRLIKSTQDIPTDSAPVGAFRATGLHVGTHGESWQQDMGAGGIPAATTGGNAKPRFTKAGATMPKSSGYVELKGRAGGFSCGTCKHAAGSFCTKYKATIDRAHGCCNAWQNTKMERLRKYITGNGPYTVHAENGREFGTYQTREEAERRLGQMEHFKHAKKGVMLQGPPQPWRMGQGWTQRDAKTESFERGVSSEERFNNNVKRANQFHAAVNPGSKPLSTYDAINATAHTMQKDASGGSFTGGSGLMSTTPGSMQFRVGAGTKPYDRAKWFNGKRKLKQGVVKAILRGGLAKAMGKPLYGRSVEEGMRDNFFPPVPYDAPNQYSDAVAEWLDAIGGPGAAQAQIAIAMEEEEELMQKMGMQSPNDPMSPFMLYLFRLGNAVAEQTPAVQMQMQAANMAAMGGGMGQESPPGEGNAPGGEKEESAGGDEGNEKSPPASESTKAFAAKRQTFRGNIAKMSRGGGGGGIGNALKPPTPQQIAANPTKKLPLNPKMGILKAEGDAFQQEGFGHYSEPEGAGGHREPKYKPKPGEEEIQPQRPKPTGGMKPLERFAPNPRSPPMEYEGGQPQMSIMDYDDAKGTHEKPEVDWESPEQEEERKYEETFHESGLEVPGSESFSNMAQSYNAWQAIPGNMGGSYDDFTADMEASGGNYNVMLNRAIVRQEHDLQFSFRQRQTLDPQTGQPAIDPMTGKPLKQRSFGERLKGLAMSTVRNMLPEDFEDRAMWHRLVAGGYRIRDLQREEPAMRFPGQTQAQADVIRELERWDRKERLKRHGMRSLLGEPETNWQGHRPEDTPRPLPMRVAMGEQALRRDTERLMMDYGIPLRDLREFSPRMDPKNWEQVNWVLKQYLKERGRTPFTEPVSARSRELREEARRQSGL